MRKLRAHAASLSAAVLISVCVLPAGARAAEWFDGRLQLHGSADMQLRGLSENFSAQTWYLSQWAWRLNLELEGDIAPDGFGPFDLISAYARVEIRYECVYNGCGTNAHRYFGDQAYRAPARNWRDGVTGTTVGNVSGVNESRMIHDEAGSRLLTLLESPLFEPLADLGADNLEATIAPVKDDLFAFKRFDGTREAGSFQMGPWSTRSKIEPNGALRSVRNVTQPLPLRPRVPDYDAGGTRAQGLYIPSHASLSRRERYGKFDQNFSEHDLQWNHGGSQQDNRELKEAYLDLEMFDSQLWIRIGLQNIVWGKTELFRTTDQFNPTDIGLSSLPSLEESRIALWAVRGVWSFYDIGPFEDVRLEIAANIDDFEPTDLGRCGEPYTIWLVCGKSLGLWGHGVTGLGVPGEIRPEAPWDDINGIEVGGRLEWRWKRFSFALMDFWGYSDSPSVEAINFYGRNVDPVTGRPLDVNGDPLRPGNALDLHSGNRSLFDLACSATVGVAANLISALADNCLLDLMNSRLNLAPSLGISFPPEISAAEALGSMLAGSAGGQLVAHVLLGLPLALPPFRLTTLNRDPGDGPPSGSLAFFDGISLTSTTTPEQQALLGCGPFYFTNCDSHGIDLFNSEASVLLQAFPFMEDMPAVATRFADGKTWILPGARGPGDPGYDRRVDGSPPKPTKLTRVPGDPKRFPSEMYALSLNFARVLAVLELGGDDPDPGCSLTSLGDCGTVRALLGVSALQSPDVRAGGNGAFGRRDFLWLAGGEAVLKYAQNNVLGFSMDFAEDITKTNWGIEFTWIADSPFSSTESMTLLQEADVYNLTISMDRPTFINFLNANRTFFFNTQWFLQYQPGWDQTRNNNGPWNVLFTVAAATGYYQDRLLPSVALVYDLMSQSGGILPGVSYRFTSNFSASFGIAMFWGQPQKNRAGLYGLAPSNNGGDFQSRSGYRGLSAIAERDEVYLRLRYTF